MTKQGNEALLSPLVIGGLPKFMSFTFHRFIERVLWTFAELNIADLMAAHKTPLTATELCLLQGNNWNTAFLYRLLRAVAVAGIVKELSTDGGDSLNDIHPEKEIRFQLTDDGLFLTTDHPSKARDLIRLELGSITQKPSEFLPYLIQHGYQDGNGFEQAFGCTLFDYVQGEENKEHSAIFNNAMVAYSMSSSISIPSLIDFSRFEKLVDIGGGFGTLLSLIMEKYQQLSGVVFDLAHVIGEAQKQKSGEFEQRHIASHRYQLVSGDMFKPETIPQADSYIMKFIIHDWNDDDSARILTSIRSANKSHEKRVITLFLVEMVITSDRTNNWKARGMDIEMLSLLNAKERTTAEYKRLLEKSGYEFKKLHSIDGPYYAIEATAMAEIFD